MKPQRPTATFTRPADTTAYAANDLVANSTTAGSVSAMTFTMTSGGGWARQVTLHKTGVSVSNAAFRLWLFSAAPTMANGDNAAFAMSAPGFDTVLGTMDVTIDQVYGDAIGFARIDTGLWVPPTFYGLLEARGAYTPENAEVFSVAVAVEADG
jgi:hypothetical protein